MSENGKKPMMTRRTFVKVAGLAGTGLALGIGYKVMSGPGVPYTDAAFAPNPFLRIETDGSITVMVGKAEMGQGVATSLPMLVAEELEVPFERVAFAFAPAHLAYGAALGMQVTGGSTSIVEMWEVLREAGATAREMLREAAAQEWDVPAADVVMRDAMAHHPDGSTLAYADLAVAAASVAVPENVPLKDPSEFRIIGLPQPRLDVPQKTTGQAIFGVDAGPADARVAMVARCPVFGGAVRSFDATAALAMPGVQEVLEISSGVAVLADGYWPALKGRDALVVEWDEGEAAGLDDAEISRRLAAGIDEGGGVAAEHGAVEAATGGEAITAEYELPYLAHATMEPMNCTALVEDGRCTVWAATQFQNGPAMLGGGGARQVAAAAAGVSADDTVVHSTFLGGGFGRRAEKDFVQEAAEIAGRVEGAVRVMWSREDDMQHDFYRPASLHRLSATLDDAGNPAVWRHDMASQSILNRLLPEWMPGFVRNRTVMKNGVDPTSAEGASNQPYRVPNFRMTAATVELPVPVGFWRSVGHTHSAFVVESFIDELAHAAGQDPYEYRRDLLAEHPRHRAVLNTVAEAADWGSEVPEGRARGIAVAESFGSYVAEIAEVSLGEDGRPRVHKVWCAVDCGVVVNPAIVRAQMESGIIFGLTAALYGKITIEDGRAVQSNFHDYEMVRMSEAPEMHVVLAPSGDGPGGVGEPGVPPIAPAVTNALFALTGQRVRTLPIALG